MIGALCANFKLMSNDQDKVCIHFHQLIFCHGCLISEVISVMEDKRMLMNS